MSSDLTIVIDSFDGYSDVWDVFFECFERFWPNCPYEKVLITNNLDYYSPSLGVIKTGNEIDWIHRTANAIERVQSEFVLLLLEDYLLSKMIDTSIVCEFIRFMKISKSRYLRLVEIPESRYKRCQSQIIPIYKNEEYGINLQASIWNREFLLDELRKIQRGSAWDFEVYFLKNVEDGSRYKLEGCYTAPGNLLGFHNGILKGKWFPKEINYYKKLGININYKERGKLSFLNSVKYEMIQFVKRNISYGMRRMLKKIFTRIGMQFVSDV